MALARSITEVSLNRIYAGIAIPIKASSQLIPVLALTSYRLTPILLANLHVFLSVWKNVGRISVSLTFQPFQNQPASRLPSQLCCPPIEEQRLTERVF